MNELKFAKKAYYEKQKKLDDFDDDSVFEPKQVRKQRAKDVLSDESQRMKTRSPIRGDED